MKKILVLSVFLCFLCGCLRVEESVSQSSILMSGSEYIGLTETKDRKILKEFIGVDPVNYQWCAAFVNAVLHENGLEGSESVSDVPLMARSFLTYGEERYGQPQRGDIIIFPRGNKGWEGHVGFFVMETIKDGKTYWVILGGNQGNEVSYDLYDPNKALSIRKYG